MTLPPLQRIVRVLNRQGLHARPADLLVRRAGEFESQIWIHKGSEQVDCRSILSLLTLGATEGTELKLTAQGQDAAQALEAIGDLFDQGFQELNQTDPPPACSSGNAGDRHDHSPN